MKTIKDSIKIASWEAKNLIWNKSFIISLLIMVIIGGLFIGVPRLLEKIAEEEPVAPLTTIYIIDEIGIYEPLSQKIADIDNLILKKHMGHKDDLRNRIKDGAIAGYIHITEEIFETREINLITSRHDTYISFAFNAKLIETLRRVELEKYNIEPGNIDNIIFGFGISVDPLIDFDPMDFIRKWASPVFAMLIFFMVMFSGMMTMQSAISDKRDKMVEILLSSVSATSLMYGKIIGNFLAGLVQVAAYGIFVVIVFHFFGLPGDLADVSVHYLLSYIPSPELPLLLLFALSGYFLFSSLYAGMGATMEDIQSAGNFQGIVILLPVIPFIFISHIIANPGGIIAQVGSYIPFTTATVMIVRMTLLDLSLVEIIVPMVILLVSTVLMAKLAGKIFKTGMLMYGKEADPKEMWKWVRQ